MPCGDGATGPAMSQSRAVGTPAEHLVAYQHQPGSNGGVHRGPDLGIRRNVMEGLLMRALIRDGVLLIVDDQGKRRRRHRSKIPMAMAENLVTRLQLIVLYGSDQNVLRLAAVANDIFRPPKDKNGANGHMGPIAATFQRPPPAEPVTPEAPAPAASGTLLDANGQEYV